MRNIRKNIAWFFILATLIAGSLKSSAETVSQKEAKRIARLFFNDAYSTLCEEPQYVYNGKRLTTDRLFTPFYVFNSPEGGFVIISAENKAFPILGYSLSRPGFPKDKLKEEEKILLRNFARDIELIRFDSRIPSDAMEAWQEIPTTIHSILYAPTVLAENYYRHRPDEESLWVLRDRAVEFPYEWPKTDLELRLEEEMYSETEEEPFSFYESFLQEIVLEQEAKSAALEEVLSPSRPVVRNLGGAHFTIDTPYPINIVNVYNAEGALVKRQYYADRASVSMDLSNLPKGFYFAQLLSEGRKPMNVKLYR